MSLVWFWNQNNGGFIEQVEKYSFRFHFLEEFVSNWYYFFLTCLVEFTSESIWAWSFLCGKFFNYKFNFFIWYRSIQVMYFLVSELWHFCSFDTVLSCFQADINWPTQREYFSKQSQDHSPLWPNWPCRLWRWPGYVQPQSERRRDPYPRKAMGSRALASSSFDSQTNTLTGILASIPIAELEKFFCIKVCPYIIRVLEPM